MQNLFEQEKQVIDNACKAVIKTLQDSLAGSVEEEDRKDLKEVVDQVHNFFGELEAKVIISERLIDSIASLIDQEETK